MLRKKKDLRSPSPVIIEATVRALKGKIMEGGVGKLVNKMNSVQYSTVNEGRDATF